MAVQAHDLGFRGFSPRRARRLRRTGAWIVALTVGLGVLLGGGTGHSGPTSRKAITVQAGQTMWDIAERHAPDGMDPRAYIDALEDLNGLDGTLPAGARIELPR